MVDPIKAEIPGIFYRRPDPDADPYVTEGSTVEPGQTIGLIEVMKTFNEVKSETAGRVARFLVENEDEVTMGQDLAEIEPA